MERLQITTLAAQDITDSLLVATYTATADKRIQAQLLLTGLAGNGTYRACMTRQPLGVGAAIQSATTGIALAATVTTGWLPTIDLAVKNTDVVKVYVQGLAGDTSVGVVIEIWDVTATADGGTTPALIWAYDQRTLTHAAAGSSDSTKDATITRRRGDSWSISITGLGNISARTKLWATWKRDPDDDDSEAILQVEETAGLLYVNGAAATGIAANGDITIDDAVDGDITIIVDETVTDDVRPTHDEGLYFDVQMKTATSVTTLDERRFKITADVTRSVA